MSPVRCLLLIVALPLAVAAAVAACSGPIDPTPPDPHIIFDPDLAFLLQDAGQDASEDAP